MRLAFRLSGQAGAAGAIAVRAAAADHPQAHPETSHSPQTPLWLALPAGLGFALKLEPVPVTTYIVAEGELRAEMMST